MRFTVPKSNRRCRGISRYLFNSIDLMNGFVLPDDFCLVGCDISLGSSVDFSISLIRAGIFSSLKIALSMPALTRRSVQIERMLVRGAVSGVTIVSGESIESSSSSLITNLRA